MYERYDGLIFDMDGTILDTEVTHRKAWREVLARYGMTFDEQVLTGLNGSPSWRIAQTIIASQQADYDPWMLAKEKTVIARSMLLDTDGARTLPLIEVVKQWHGNKPLALGTGSEHALAEALLRKLDLLKYFTVIVGADDVEHHKPEPETFLRCASLMGVAPEKCIVFEDADFGVQAARAAGMAVVDVRLL